MPFRLVPLAAGVLLAAVPSPALAQSGGAAAPDSGGGHVFEQPAPKRGQERPPRLRATIFTVTPGTVELGQAAALRLAGRRPRAARHRARRARARGRRARPIAVALGTPPRGHAAPCAPGRRRASPPGATPRGCTRRGPGGAKLRRTARASGRPDARGHRARPAAASPAAAGAGAGQRHLPRAGRLLLRRRGRALRRRPHGPRAPGPGHHRRRGHAGRHAASPGSCTGAPTRPTAPATTS